MRDIIVPDNTTELMPVDRVQMLYQRFTDHVGNENITRNRAIPFRAHE